MNRNGCSSPGKVRGVGLIEVLIAVLVLAIGLLGLAAMQSAALRNSQSALERSTAITSAYAILDAMRANHDQMLNQSYDLPTYTCTPPAVVGGDLVKTDQHDWLTSLQQSIASACGRIDCTPSGETAECEVGIQWDDSRGTNGSTAQEFVTRTRI